MTTQQFHFTLGPVQGFVAQARRTRDFWAGSFLLSWLSGIAMAEVIRQGGKIVFPLPAHDYLQWIQGEKPSGSQPPRQGGIPNRFKATVPQQFDAALVAQTVRDAWQALANHVWQHDQLQQLNHSQTETIWQRQHRRFWDVSWALAQSDAQASALLDQRKNWRSHFAQPESGVKCMVMDGWQEMSGALRPLQFAKSSFWSQLRIGKETDILESEQLCAIAYVKRRFVRSFAAFSCTLPSGLAVKGWPLSSGMPSVSYLAATHWLEQLVDGAPLNQIQRLYDAAKQAGAGHDEWDTHLACLDAVYKKRSDGQAIRKLLALDGNIFFNHVHDNAARYGYAPEAMKMVQTILRDMAKQKESTSAPSPFYALLLMDGDSLGVHMSEPRNQQPISAALEIFTNGVAKIVHKHNGFLIYAGGDDVLALLPVEDAIGCAAAVRVHYLHSFASQSIKIPTTISAAIEFAHVKMPLVQILHDSHDLLDNVAKEFTGRDALAVRVWKPGGMNLQWSQPWEKALNPATQQSILEEIANHFRVQNSADAEHQFSSKFFYRIRERFALLNPADQHSNAILSEEDAAKLLAVDYLHSGDNRKNITLEHAQKMIQPLLEQARPQQRVVHNQSIHYQKSNELQPDAALLVRFLALKGVEQ
jgi:CRISPR-associated protein Cmr2